MRPAARGALATCVLLASLAPAAAAQMAAAGELMQAYSFGDPAATGLESFRLITLPFGASVQLTDRIGVQASGAYAQGTAIGSDGAQASLSGLTDTDVGVSVALGPDRYVLTASASLPTGSSAYSTQESVVAGIVAAELLPFAITSWGTGGRVGGDLAVALQSGRWGVGLAGGYRMARSYEPLSDQVFSYRPGDQLGLRLAVDRDVSESSTLSLLAGFQRFGADQLGGTNLFQSGNRIEGILSYAFPVGVRSSALVYGGLYHRANGALLLATSVLSGATGSPSQQLYTSGVQMRVPLGRRGTLLPEIEGRLFRSSDGVGQGWLSSAGAALDLIAFGRRSRGRVVLAPSARVRWGWVVVRDGVASGMTGWEAGLVARWEGGR